MVEKKFVVSEENNCYIVATYECEMQQQVQHCDGYDIELGAEPEEHGNMILYVGGKRFDSCWQPPFWRLINDPQVGAHKIWGMQAAFRDDEKAARYEAWLADLIDEGTSDEVKAYRAAQAQKAHEEAVKRAKRVIAKAERQRDIPSREEAARQMKLYNDINNEGGEGYVPYIYCREEYEEALKIVAGEN